jgi:hypothetical protein
VLQDADPALKAQVYADLGLRLAYRPGEKLVSVEAASLTRRGQRHVKGRATNASSQVACAAGRVGRAFTPKCTPLIRVDLSLTA